MIKWLDFRLFGSGRGLAVPYFDGRFYWLVDTYQANRDGKNGQFYTFSGGLGAQLTSFQWTHPNAGEERVLAGRRFRPLHSTREGPRVRISWAWQDRPKGLDEANAAIRELEQELGRN